MEELYKAFWDYMLTKDADLVNDWKTKRDTAVDSAISIAQEAVRQALAAAEEVQPTGFECPVCMETVNDNPGNIVCRNGHNAACASCASHFRSTRCPVCRLANTIPRSDTYVRALTEYRQDAERYRNVQNARESSRAPSTIRPPSERRPAGSNSGQLPEGVWERISALNVGDSMINVQMRNYYSGTNDGNPGLQWNTLNVSVSREASTYKFTINDTVYGWSEGSLPRLQFRMRVSTLDSFVTPSVSLRRHKHVVRRNGIGIQLVAY